MSNFMSNDNALTVFTKYANAINSKCEQVSTIPTASQDYENKILQYVGETSGGFNNGYFYKCVNNNGTYKWNVVGIANDTNFSGTLEAFNQLPQEEQDKYETRDLWNDFNGMPIDKDLDSSSNHPVENQAIAKNIEAVVNVYGSKNLLPNGFTSQVINGVTFTVNSDGSITANGTCNSNNGSYLELDFAKCNLTKGAEYIVSGCPTGGSENTYYITIAGNWGGQAGQRLARDIGEEAVFTYPTQSATIERIYIVAANANGQQVNLTFRPMIRDSRITDPTYVSYAMSNRELTNSINTLNYIGNVITLNSYVKYQIIMSNLLMVELSYDQSMTSWQTVTLGTLPSNIVVMSQTTMDCGISGADHHFTRCRWSVTANNEVKLATWDDSISVSAEPLSRLIVPIRLT